MTDYLDGQHFNPYVICGPTFTSDIICKDSDTKETLRICSDGRIFWHGREVETDDEFKGCILELLTALKRKINHD